MTRNTSDVRDYYTKYPKSIYSEMDTPTKTVVILKQLFIVLVLMPATLALAASIHGRVQDEMVHIMVDDVLFNTDWYFPTDSNDPKQEVEISQIPYLRLKNFISGINVEDPLEAVSITQTRLDELSPLTKVKIAGSRIIVDGNEYRFPPAEMQLWRYMARKKLEHCVREDLEFCGSCNECYSKHIELRDEFDNKIADEYLIKFFPIIRLTN